MADVMESAAMPEVGVRRSMRSPLITKKRDADTACLTGDHERSMRSKTTLEWTALFKPLPMFSQLEEAEKTEDDVCAALPSHARAHASPLRAHACTHARLT